VIGIVGELVECHSLGIASVQALGNPSFVVMRRAVMEAERVVSVGRHSAHSRE
jgi:hypothetical protein